MYLFNTILPSLLFYFINVNERLRNNEELSIAYKPILQH